MFFDTKLIKKIFVIMGVVTLVLIVGVFFPPKADPPLAEKNENQRIFVSRAEVQGISDEIAAADDLKVDKADESDNEILRLTPQNDIPMVQNNEKSRLSDDEDFYKVVKVIDGDTIVVDVGGKNETIRLIGIDAPEAGGTKGAECFGKEAEEFAKKILSNANVLLEKDESQNDRDKYGRILRYVILENGESFNKQMISGGLAKEYTYKIAYKYQIEFRQVEQEAKEAEIGLWRVCNKSRVNSNERSDQDQSSTQIDAENVSNDCYCESNKYNCSNFKTPSEAQKIFKCCMAKTGQDIHKLDRNSDGQVCESLRD